MKPKRLVLGATFALIAFLTPISFSISNPADVSIQTQETHFTQTQLAALTPVVSSAEARVRIDPGLPMTRVPFRYSIYFFMLAIILTNVFDSVRRNRRMNKKEEHSLPLHTSSVS
jgi:hypothetical protein